MAKMAKANKFYIDADGVRSKHASPAARLMVLVFTNGHEIVVDPAKFSKEISHCTAFHGLGQKVVDSYSGTATVDEAIENAEAMVENLTEGRWINRAEGLVRTTVLAAALCRVKPEKYASVEVAAAEIKENWDMAKRKDVLDTQKGVPALIAAYASIQAERASERAAKLSKDATDNAKGVADL